MPAMPAAEVEAEAETMPEAEAEAEAMPEVEAEAAELMVDIRAAHEGLAAKLGRFEELMMRSTNNRNIDDRAAQKPAVAA